MACKVCGARLVLVAVSRSKLHANLGGGYAYATPGPIHCPKCKIVYDSDPDGDKIETDTSLLDKEPEPSKNLWMALPEKALTATELGQLSQLVDQVSVWPGAVMSKYHCDSLIKKSLAMRHQGNYVAPAHGVRILRGFRDAVKGPD